MTNSQLKTCYLNEWYYIDSVLLATSLLVYLCAEEIPQIDARKNVSHNYQNVENDNVANRLLFWHEIPSKLFARMEIYDFPPPK